MTIEELIGQVNQLRHHTFTQEQLVMWLNECEGHIQTDVLLLPLQEVMAYKWTDTWSGAGISFPEDDKMQLPEAPGWVAGGTVVIKDLTTYSANNSTSARQILDVSRDGLTFTFAEGTFSATGTEGDAGTATLTYDGKTVELIALPPHDKLYRPYLLAQIAFAQEEWDGYENQMAMYNSYLSEYKRWFARTYHPAIYAKR